MVSASASAWPTAVSTTPMTAVTGFLLWPSDCRRRPTRSAWSRVSARCDSSAERYVPRAASSRSGSGAHARAHVRLRGLRSGTGSASGCQRGAYIRPTVRVRLTNKCSGRVTAHTRGCDTVPPVPLLHRSGDSSEPPPSPRGRSSCTASRSATSRSAPARCCLLVHGITSSSRTWGAVLPLLAEQHTVIAPDLLGHGASGKPRGDYSLGAHASSLARPAARARARARDDGRALARRRDRDAVRLPVPGAAPSGWRSCPAAGSGGRSASLLRAATLPGAEYVLPVLAGKPVRGLTSTGLKALGRLGIRPNADGIGIGEGFGSLGDVEARGRSCTPRARSSSRPASA